MYIKTNNGDIQGATCHLVKAHQHNTWKNPAPSGPSHLLATVRFIEVYSILLYCTKNLKAERYDIARVSQKAYLTDLTARRQKRPSEPETLSPFLNYHQG
jgi:hypothetical protein